MIDCQYCLMMAQYNQWMNQTLYQICDGIPDVERKRDRGAFFGSIHGTLNHLLYGDFAWVGRFKNQPDAIKAIGQDLYADFAQLRQVREQTDREIVAWSVTLAQSWLQQPCEYTSNMDQKTRVIPTWILVVHLFNRQTHHRGQITTLLSQMGYDVGVTDLPWLPSLSA